MKHWSEMQAQVILHYEITLYNMTVKWIYWIWWSHDSRIVVSSATCRPGSSRHCIPNCQSVAKASQPECLKESDLALQFCIAFIQFLSLPSFIAHCLVHSLIHWFIDQGIYRWNGVDWGALKSGKAVPGHSIANFLLLRWWSSYDW